jgi:hypothetical protein
MVVWTIVEWVSTLLSFAGTVMIASHLREGWLYCTVADVGFVIFAVNNRLYGFLTLCACYAAINLYGWFT